MVSRQANSARVGIGWNAVQNSRVCIGTGTTFTVNPKTELNNSREEWFFVAGHCIRRQHYDRDQYCFEISQIGSGWHHSCHQPHLWSNSKGSNRSHQQVKLCVVWVEWMLVLSLITNLLCQQRRRRHSDLGFSKEHWKWRSDCTNVRRCGNQVSNRPAWLITIL